jgi:hypothetical protein
LLLLPSALLFFILTSILFVLDCFLSFLFLISFLWLQADDNAAQTTAILGPVMVYNRDALEQLMLTTVSRMTIMLATTTPPPPPPPPPLLPPPPKRPPSPATIPRQFKFSICWLCPLS